MIWSFKNQYRRIKQSISSSPVHYSSPFGRPKGNDNGRYKKTLISREIFVSLNRCVIYVIALIEALVWPILTSFQGELQSL